MACHNPNCDCKHKEPAGAGGGFALGVAIGAAAAVLLTPDEGKKMRKKARAKLDELTGGRTPEEMLEAIKEVAGNVVDDIRDAKDEGVEEAEETTEKVMQGKHPVRKPPRRRKQPKTPSR